MAKTPTDIRSLARAHTATAIRVLAGIMEQPDAPEAARVSAANALLDRGWGKAPQTLHVTDKPLDPDSLSDGELVAIASGRSSDTFAPSRDPSELN